MIKNAQFLNYAEETALGWEADAGRRETAEHISRTIIRKIPLQKDWKVLDFGAGTGLISNALSPLVGTIWAVDSSPEMIEELKSKQISNVYTKVMDWKKTSFPERNFQLVILSMTLHHIKNYKKLLNKLYKIVKEKGWICLADLYSEPGTFHSDRRTVAHFGFDPNRLCRELAKIGFEDISYSHIYTITSKKTKSADNTFPVFFMYGRKKS